MSSFILTKAVARYIKEHHCNDNSGSHKSYFFDYNLDVSGLIQRMFYTNHVLRKHKGAFTKRGHQVYVLIANFHPQRIGYSSWTHSPTSKVKLILSHNTKTNKWRVINMYPY